MVVRNTRSRARLPWQQEEELGKGCGVARRDVRRTHSKVVAEELEGETTTQKIVLEFETELDDGSFIEEEREEEIENGF